MLRVQVELVIMCNFMDMNLAEILICYVAESIFINFQPQSKISY